MSRPAYYITTPIYYVNDVPHIGHAYTTIAADVLARFHRLAGYKTLFLTGTDEHGQKVEKSARKEGLTPKEFVDKVSQHFRDLLPLLSCQADQFIRTTEERHKKCAQNLWQRLQEREQIYLSSYAGWYSVRDETYFSEDELVDGKAPTGAAVEWIEEPSYFFKLSKWQEPLLQFYEQNPDFIGPKSRRNEVVSFVQRGLRDLSISRSTFSWGIPVPGDDKHVMYVWIEALSNYLTAIGFPDEDSQNFQDFWPQATHLVGKDILIFHAVYWPALLLAAGLKPPKRVFAHGWWTNEGQKISKSLGNTIDPVELVNTYGVDQFRYFVMREVTFGNDADFSKTAFINRVNSDLANDFGNLAQRVLSFINKHAEAKVPTPGELTKEDQEVLDKATGIFDKAQLYASAQEIHKMLQVIWEVVAAANRYVDAQEPWALRKSDVKRMQTVLYVLAEVIRQLAVHAQIITPVGAAKILDYLAIENDQRDFASLSSPLQPDKPLPVPEPVFPRLDI